MQIRHNVTTNKIIHKNIKHVLTWYRDMPEPKKLLNKESERKAMNRTGDKPGKGTYQCPVCGEIIVLENDTDTLPPCPKCHALTWDKL